MELEATESASGRLIGLSVAAAVLGVGLPGSGRGADRAAAMTTLIMTAKLNDVDPQAWLADVLGQIADIPQGRLAELLPWNWKQPNLQAAA